MQILMTGGVLVWIGLLEIASLALFGVLLQMLAVPEAGSGKFPPILRNFFSFFGVHGWESPGLGAISWAALLFGGVMMVAGSCRILVTWLCCRLTAALGTDVTTEVYERCLSQNYEEYITYRAGELVSLVRDKASEVVSVIFYLLNLATSLVVGLLIVSGLVFLDPVFFVLTVAILGSFYGICGLWSRRSMGRNSRINAEGTTLITKAVQEGFGAFRDIILDGSQKIYARIFREAEYRTRRASAANIFLSMTPRYLTETLAMVVFAGILWWGATFGENFRETLPRLGVLALGAQRLMPLIQQGYMSWAVLSGSAVATRMILEILQREPVDRTVPKADALPFRNSLVFRNVSFRYGQDKPWVLRDFHLSLHKGERIGVIGKTGSGKSTFVDILMGLLLPTAGEILVDGKILTWGELPRWRKNIAHVPQDIFLADASFAENIALGCEPGQIDMARVRTAARQAQIADFIESKPRGYREEVGDRGRNLSGGQRQRLGIARALYKQAQILVFDEATSALDGKTEQAVMESIHQLDPQFTVVMITHRPSVLAGCTQVVDLAASGAGSGAKKSSPAS